LLTNFFADAPSPFGIVGHPSAEDKAARAMAKQQTKKEEIKTDFKPYAISGPANFAQETEVGSSTASFGSGTTFASVYNARPVFSGHLDEDEKIARAMVKQETKKESNVQLTFTNGQFTDMANKIEAYEFMNLNLENFAQLPPKDEEEASTEGELNRSEFTSASDEVPHEKPLEVAPNSADSTLPSSTITTELSQEIGNIINNEENASSSMESPNTTNKFILTAENANGYMPSSYPEDSPSSSSILTEIESETSGEKTSPSMKSSDSVESHLKYSNYFLVPENGEDNQSGYLTSSIPEDSSVLSSILTTERSQENETEENVTAYVESPNVVESFVESLPSTLILAAVTNEGNAMPSSEPADFTSPSSILTTELSQETETSEENASAFEFSNPPTETPSLITTSTNEENAVPSPDPMDSPFLSSLITTELITELSQKTETYEESVSVSLESAKPMFIETALTNDSELLSSVLTTELSQETDTNEENASISKDYTKDDNAVSSFDTMDFLLPKLSQETETHEGDTVPMETPNLASTDPFPKFIVTESNDKNAEESTDRMDFSLPSFVLNTKLSQDTEIYEEGVSASLESPNPMSIESPEPMDSALLSSVLTTELSQETETYEENASTSMKEEIAVPSLDTTEFPLPSSMPAELFQETETYEGDAGVSMESPNLVSTDSFPNVILNAEPNQQNAEESP